MNLGIGLQWHLRAVHRGDLGQDQLDLPVIPRWRPVVIRQIFDDEKRCRFVFFPGDQGWHERAADALVCMNFSLKEFAGQRCRAGFDKETGGICFTSQSRRRRIPAVNRPAGPNL